ncbi:tetratricopeptide repeat protein [Sulfurospirillum sp. 1612]|uniref:tetratricopeptide repeat protein n=1 Tax=Sulfurospirillum sp. 1612 TaxID=3094835 RepID=UPI002F94D465
MSRYNAPLVFILLFLFYGCSTKEPTSMIGKKTFQNEDVLILKALEYQREKQYDNALETYKILYEKSHKVNYLEEEARLSFLSNNQARTLDILNRAIEKYPNNILFKRLKSGYYMKTKAYSKAEKLALEILKRERNAENLSLLGDIYFLEKSYNLSLKYYESAFKTNESENLLLNMVNLLYKFLDRKKEAISYLETYIRMKDASEHVYFALVRIYGQEKNIDGLISTYEELYTKFKKDEYGKKAIELLIYKKDKQAAIKFLEESDYNPQMLLDLYTSNKDYKNAYRIAQSLYKKTNNIDFLAKMAIFEYEKNKNHLNPKILNSISNKFETVIEKFHDPVYLNYYGYLLIDHDLNIKKGIKLVKLALESDKNSPFYLDSLAWGYYKLDECRKALEVMKKIINETNEPEVLLHYKMIQQCLNQKNSKEKQ